MISNYDINTFRWLSKIARDIFNIPPEGLRLQIDVYDNISDIVYQILIFKDNDWFMIEKDTDFKNLIINFSDYLLEYNIN